MAKNAWWEMIRRGKNDPPQLLFDPSEPLIYDPDDTDGIYFMLNRHLSGCMVLYFSKPMQNIQGTVMLNGVPVPAILETIHTGGGTVSWCLGIRLRGKTGYGQRGMLSISGWTDQDGLAMRPIEVPVVTEKMASPDPAFADHEAVALQAAEDGIVLLKNDSDILPLKKGTALNFFGKGIHEFRTCAVGAGKTNPRYTVNLLTAAERENDYPLNRRLAEFYACGEDRIPDTALLADAKAKSDIAILVLTRPAGENMDITSDKGEFYLSDEEEALANILRTAFAHTVVLLNVGHPISLGFTRQNGIDAVLYTGFGGMMGGQAIMNVLTGRVNPSGKLPDTWADCYTDIPASANFYDARNGRPRYGADDGDVWIDTVYEEGLYVGYRYFESTGKSLPHYPFGFGLSYTAFELQTPECREAPDEIYVTVAVRNTGSVSGREVAQIYVHKPEGRMVKPAIELVAFEKTKLLSPGERQELSFHIPLRRLSSYDEEAEAFVMEAGSYELFAGDSAIHLSRCGSIHNPALRVIRNAPARMRPVNMIAEMQNADDLPQGKNSGIRPVKALEPLRPVTFLPGEWSAEKNGTTVSFRDVVKRPEMLERFVSSMSAEEMARVSVCFSHGWGMEGRGEAGRLAKLSGRELPDFIVSDGNSGVNLHDRNIGLPSGVTLCASFDRQLMERAGRVIGEEARCLGIDMILAPAFNLHRNPLNGRNAEYFSEDPLLAGVLAGCYCRGLESTGVGGCYKHLMANNAEASRKRNQSLIPLRALRELYFAAFEYALTEYEPLSVMTAYNAVNGRFTSADPELIQGMLRQEMGFKGFVMTDWNSYDTASVVEMAAAGISWITPGSSDDEFTAPIAAAVQDGRLSEDQLRENVCFLLRALLKLENMKRRETLAAI